MKPEDFDLISGYLFCVRLFFLNGRLFCGNLIAARFDLLQFICIRGSASFCTYFWENLVRYFHSQYIVGAL